MLGSVVLELVVEESAKAGGVSGERDIDWVAVEGSGEEEGAGGEGGGGEGEGEG